MKKKTTTEFMHPMEKNIKCKALAKQSKPIKNVSKNQNNYKFQRNQIRTDNWI